MGGLLEDRVPDELDDAPSEEDAVAPLLEPPVAEEDAVITLLEPPISDEETPISDEDAAIALLETPISEEDAPISDEDAIITLLDAPISDDDVTTTPLEVPMPDDEETTPPEDPELPSEVEDEPGAELDAVKMPPLLLEDALPGVSSGRVSGTRTEHPAAAKNINGTSTLRMGTSMVVPASMAHANEDAHCRARKLALKRPHVRGAPGSAAGGGRRPAAAG